MVKDNTTPSNEGAPKEISAYIFANKNDFKRIKNFRWTDKINAFSALMNVVIAIIVGRIVFLQFSIMEYDQRPWITIAGDGSSVIKMKPAGKSSGSLTIQVKMINTGKSPASAVNFYTYLVPKNESTTKEEYNQLALSEQNNKCVNKYNKISRSGELMFQSNNERDFILKNSHIDIPLEDTLGARWIYVIGCIKYIWGRDHIGITTVIWSVGSDENNFHFTEKLEATKIKMYWFRDMQGNDGGRFAF